MNIRELQILLARGEAGEKLVELLEELDSLRAERDALKAQLEQQAADMAACERAGSSLEDQAQLLDLIREAIVVHDRATGRIAFWNPGAEDLYGWSAAEAVGKEANTLLKTRFPRPIAEVEEILTREGVWEGELVHTRRDGQTLTVASRWTPKLDDEGETVAIVETNVDITARKREEVTRKQLATIVEQAREAIIAVDRAGLIKSWNRAAERMFGYTAEEAVGQPLQLLFPDGHETELERRRRALSGERLAPYETFRRRKDGTLIPVMISLSPLRDEAGAVTGVAGLVWDLSEEKRLGAELESHARALDRQQAFTSRLINDVPAGIAYLDRDLVIRWANPEYARQVSWITTDFLDRPIAEVFPKATEPDAGMKEVLAHHRTVRSVVSYPGPGDERTYWDVSLVPILDEARQVEGIVVMVLEVTDRMHKEHYQAERIASLEEADRLKDQFLSILSHELRTPINAIMGFGSILDDELAGPLTAQQHGYMDKILCNSDRLLRLVDDLLVLSRAIAGKLVLEARPMQLADPAAKALEAIRSDAADKQMTLKDALPDDLPAVFADPDRLYQVLSHLLENALKFTPAGGTITLSAAASGEKVRVVVSDTGPGVPPEAAPCLFKAFTQLDMSATRPVGGTGLGLSLVKTLIEALGGEVGVEPAPGGGAAFWFTLPVARADSPG